MAWTRSYAIAKKFALYGIDNIDPHNLEKAKYPPRDGWVMLHANTDPENIICAPCLLGHAEGEYIVDPRKLKTSIIDADEVATIQSDEAAE
jgi:hypothetical protein